MTELADLGRHRVSSDLRLQQTMHSLLDQLTLGGVAADLRITQTDALLLAAAVVHAIDHVRSEGRRPDFCQRVQTLGQVMGLQAAAGLQVA